MIFDNDKNKVVMVIITKAIIITELLRKKNVSKKNMYLSS